MSLTPTSQMNELCQKNRFKSVFECYENQKLKKFKMKLVITNPINHKSLSYIGICNSVRQAKHFASKKAIADNFVTKLKDSHQQTGSSYKSRDRTAPERRHSEDDRRAGYDAGSAARSNSNKRVSPSDMAGKPPPKSAIDVYDLYLAVRKLNLRPKIEFVSRRVDNLTSEVAVKIIIGNIEALETGRNDLEAIQNAARKIDPCLLVSETTSVKMKDKSDHMADLNIIHLQMNKNLEWVCLLLVENIDAPLCLFKCELGELISYGLGDNKTDAQNQAAFAMLELLRSVQPHPPNERVGWIPAPLAFSNDPRIAIPNQNPVGRNRVVVLYRRCKKLKLKPKISFVCRLRDGNTVVKITVGFESKAAQGANDLEAIDKASAQFDLNSFTCNPGNPEPENDGIAYYDILNVLHLKTLKKFESSCLLSVKEDGQSLFLCKCQLGEFVSYGLDESIELSQNVAAKDILIKLRCRLNDEIDELSKKFDEIRTKMEMKKELIDIISQVDQPPLASGEEYDYERPFKEERLDTEMFHDL